MGTQDTDGTAEEDNYGKEDEHKSLQINDTLHDHAGNYRQAVPNSQI